MSETTTRVVDYDQLYPGRFIKAGDLAGRDVNLTIAQVDLEELEGRKGKQGKGVIHFRETKKALVLNRTNGECIKAMFGRKLADWVGKRITLYPAQIESALADLALRVRGSPDIAAEVRFELCLPQKRPVQMVLKKTGTGKNGAAKPPPAPEPTDPEPPADSEPETDSAPVDF